VRRGWVSRIVKLNRFRSGPGAKVAGADLAAQPFAEFALLRCCKPPYNHPPATLMRLSGQLGQGPILTWGGVPGAGDRKNLIDEAGGGRV
jgi:hypothetical protein